MYNIRNDITSMHASILKIEINHIIHLQAFLSWITKAGFLRLECPPSRWASRVLAKTYDIAYDVQATTLYVQSTIWYFTYDMVCWTVTMSSNTTSYVWRIRYLITTTYVWTYDIVRVRYLYVQTQDIVLLQFIGMIRYRTSNIRYRFGKNPDGQSSRLCIMPPAGPLVGWLGWNLNLKWN